MNKPCNWKDSSEKLIWANSILLLQKAKVTRSPSDIAPVEASDSNNNNDRENDGDTIIADDQGIVRPPYTPQSTPTRSSTRIAAHHRDISASTDTTGSDTLSSVPNYPKIDRTLFDKPMALLEEVNKRTVSLEKAINEFDRKCRQWESTAELREKQEKERKKKKN
jgi:hypothetical protein